MSKDSPRGKQGEKPGGARLGCRRFFRQAVRLMDSYVNFGVRAFHFGVRILGPMLMCLALGLMSFVTYTFLVHAVPQLEDWGRPSQCGLTAFGLFLLTNTLYNYFKAAFMDPGQPPEYDKVRKELELQAEELQEPRPKQCRRCTRYKPQRCHHCSVCDRCVLKMDHHCPWVNNCVGFRNYRFFCLFLLYLGSACSFVIAVFWCSGILLHINRRRVVTDVHTARECIMTSFLICCSILLALSLLGGFHLYLVFSNQTTIEFQLNFARRVEARRSGEYFRNPYDLGRTRNFQQVFGPNPLWRFRWLLSWLAPPPSGDGLQFPSLRLPGSS